MSRKRIIIVEDDMIIMELHKHYVQNLGHEVVGTFTSGEDVIHFFDHDTADLILMDVRLEKHEDGIETMKKIQEKNTIPVIYITGNTEDSNLERAVGTNMKGFLSKPLAVDDLNDIIESVSELTDSIWYAQRIQRSIIPDKTKWSKYFDHPVYLNRPKDVITGDFCCLYEKRSANAFVGALGDCTGHGIPAALLSILSYQVVFNSFRRQMNPRKMILHINNQIRKALTTGSSSVHDSMELIVFQVQPQENQLVVTGTKMQYIHYRSKEGIWDFHSLRGPTLGLENKTDEGEFPQNIHHYEQGDSFYFFSDGIKDQFGGPAKRKMMKPGLLAILEKIQTIQPERRNLELEIALRKWQGNLLQTDDMLLVGFEPSTFHSPEGRKRAKA
jgi:CheY-like chemotaxis protein